jgi:hypothetical protein
VVNAKRHPVLAILIIGLFFMSAVFMNSGVVFADGTLEGGGCNCLVTDANGNAIETKPGEGSQSIPDGATVEPLGGTCKICAEKGSKITLVINQNSKFEVKNGCAFTDVDAFTGQVEVSGNADPVRGPAQPDFLGAELGHPVDGGPDAKGSSD